MVGLSLDGNVFIVVIDRVLDVIRTTTSATGDTMVALLVAEPEGLLTEQQDDDDSRFKKAMVSTSASCEILSL